MHVFSIKAEHLFEVCNELPQFRAFLLERATMRRAHFLRVLHEHLHIIELQAKFRA